MSPPQGPSTARALASALTPAHPRRRRNVGFSILGDDDASNGDDSSSPPKTTMMRSVRTSGGGGGGTITTPGFDDVELGTPSPTAAGVVDRVTGALAAPSFRERVFDEFYLFEPGDRATVVLLMRGMPLPVTYGFPKTDGGVCGNLREFVYLFHPFVSIFKVHPLCPFSAKERLVVFFCSVAFNFLWTAFTEHHRASLVDKDASRLTRTVGFYLVKHIATILYAVLIRQIVICPCLYAPLLRAATREDGDDARVSRRALKLKRWKLRGDRLALALVLAHGGAIAYATAVFATVVQGPAYLDYADDAMLPTDNVTRLILVSECVNFWFWFVKFLPLFALLYPIHRAQWFAGGTLLDYLLCRRSCAEYASASNYFDDAYPRCVVPETDAIAGARLTSLPRSLSLSTLRRISDRDAELRIQTPSAALAFPPARRRTDAYAATPRTEDGTAGGTPTSMRTVDLAEPAVRRLELTPAASEPDLSPVAVVPLPSAGRSRTRSPVPEDLAASSDAGLV